MLLFVVVVVVVVHSCDPWHGSRVWGRLKEPK